MSHTKLDLGIKLGNAASTLDEACTLLFAHKKWQEVIEPLVSRIWAEIECIRCNMRSVTWPQKTKAIALIWDLEEVRNNLLKLIK